ncbi:hypothetical protein [Streptacidiphilus neutrinimicus]|nr:hypothetical protein [Streptacidiphilus neutrinimicus]
MTTATPPAQPTPDDADRDATSEQNEHAYDHPKAEGDLETGDGDQDG